MRSEHIPYNISFPMKKNLDSVKILFTKLTGLDINSVNDIRIEYPDIPKGNTNPYLNDRTAFDVFIEYKDSSHNICGIGIEVKYTEKGYKMGKSEQAKINDPKSFYHIVTENSDCYNFNDMSEYEFTTQILCRDHSRQIWRNQMLGIAMTQTKEIRLHKFLSIHLYPEFNEHFRDVIPEYVNLLSEKGKTSFMPLTFEHLFSVMENIDFRSEDKEWKKYLRERYIGF